MILIINSINQLIFVIVKYSVFFMIWTKVLNKIANFGFKRLNQIPFQKGFTVHETVPSELGMAYISSSGTIPVSYCKLVSLIRAIA